MKKERAAINSRPFFMSPESSQRLLLFLADFFLLPILFSLNYAYSDWYFENDRLGINSLRLQALGFHAMTALRKTPAAWKPAAISSPRPARNLKVR